MGRPLSDRFWGDSNRPGFQLTLNQAWIPGELSAASNVEILKQSGTRKYIGRNTGTGNEGVVFLVNATPTSEGEATKLVYPWTGVGSGATVGSVTFSTIFASVVTGGSGYAVGNVLTVVGGTGTATQLTVQEVSSSGTITRVSISLAGSYTAIPPNLNTNAPTGGAGSGSTFRLTMGLATAAVGTGGSGYVNGQRAMAVVSGSNGVGAVLLGTVAGGVVTTWTVVGKGYGFTGSSVTGDVFGIGPSEYARTILASRVKTWEDSNYVWAKNNAATTFGQAVLVTA